MTGRAPPNADRDNGVESQSGFRRFLRDWLGGLGQHRNGDEALRGSFEEFIEKHANETEKIDAEERTMLLNMLNFGELRVDDVMIPRADIVAVEQKTPAADVVKALHEAGHSRLPVFRGTLDDIAGMVHVRDLLRYWGSDEPFTLEDIVRPLLFVTPSMRVRDLLLQMRDAHIHMAVVVDEYGGSDGLVTIEDLVEEIVGEIQDEHDTDDLPMLVEKPGGLIEVDARLPVEDLEARVGRELHFEGSEDDVDTLGGLVFSLVGRVPTRGELIAHPSGLQFEIVDADPRRIKRLLIHNAPAPPE